MAVRSQSNNLKFESFIVEINDSCQEKTKKRLKLDGVVDLNIGNCDGEPT